MITTRLVRSALAIVIVAVLGVVALEVHWSMDAKSEARKAAGSAATAAAQELGSSHDSLRARQRAEATAAAGGTQLVAFTISPTGTVRVTVDRRAKSYILRRFGPTRSVSEITVSADAKPQ